MRGLAEYAMSGRLQAATVAVLFGLIPVPGLEIICGAVVALVILRRGMQDGIQILLWALLPAGLKWKLGEPSLVLILTGVVAASLMLRNSRSWQSTILLIMLGGALLQFSLPWQEDFIGQLSHSLSSLQNSGYSTQSPDERKALAVLVTQMLDMLLSYYGTYQALMILGCLLLGRYWQAHLYNPGGFRQEFHNLRFDRQLMAVLLGVLVFGASAIPTFTDWLLLVCLVPILQGLAVVHKVGLLRKLGSAWLVLVYLLLLIAAPIYILLGFTDSLIDIRKRIATDKTGS